MQKGITGKTESAFRPDDSEGSKNGRTGRRREKGKWKCLEGDGVEILQENHRRAPDIQRSAVAPKQTSKPALPAEASRVHGKKPFSRAFPHEGENIQRSLPAKKRAVFVIKTSRFCPCHAAKMPPQNHKTCAGGLTRIINEVQLIVPRSQMQALPRLGKRKRRPPCPWREFAPPAWAE